MIRPLMRGEFGMQDGSPARSEQRRDAMSLIEPFFVNRLSGWNDGRISNGGTDKCGGIS
jgi:hypothetical protein